MASPQQQDLVRQVSDTNQNYISQIDHSQASGNPYLVAAGAALASGATAGKISRPADGVRGMGGAVGGAAALNKAFEDTGRVENTIHSIYDNWVADLRKLPGVSVERVVTGGVNWEDGAKVSWKITIDPQMPGDVPEVKNVTGLGWYWPDPQSSAQQQSAGQQQTDTPGDGLDKPGAVYVDDQGVTHPANSTDSSGNPAFVDSDGVGHPTNATVELTPEQQPDPERQQIPSSPQASGPQPGAPEDGLDKPGAVYVDDQGVTHPANSTDSSGNPAFVDSDGVGHPASADYQQQQPNIQSLPDATPAAPPPVDGALPPLIAAPPPVDGALPPPPPSLPLSDPT